MARAQPLSPREILERLIAFDTTSAKPNMPLIEWVQNYLDGFGIASRLAPNGDGTKANLFATINGKNAGNSGEGGVALSGHTDVVPVAGQDWDSDPFTLTERDGRLYGRGTADMKSFIATALALVPDMIAAGLKVPFHFAFSFDEEVGCIGVPHLLALLGRELPMPKVAIIGEPTSLAVMDRHKGICALRTSVTGREAHSSQPHRAVSAVMYATEIIGFIAETIRGLQLVRDEAFEPPHTTFNIGQIEGGTAINIVPRRCSFDWEFRTIPGVDHRDVIGKIGAFVDEKIVPRMRETFDHASVSTEVLASAPAMSPETRSPAVALAMNLTGANTTGAVSFATEAGQFQDSGISAVICGPGDIAQAHQPNEFITLEQMAAGEDFLRKLIRWAEEDGRL